MRLPGLEFRLIPGMFRLYTDFVNDALLHFFQFLCVSSVSLQIIFDVPLPIYLRYRHLRLMDPLHCTSNMNTCAERPRNIFTVYLRSS